MTDKQSSFDSYYRRRITALEGPDVLEPLKSSRDYIDLINWLENRYIRYYKIEDRKDLSSTELKTFIPAFQKYLTSLNVPHSIKLHAVESIDFRMSALQFLLDKAVTLKYEDEPAEEETDESVFQKIDTTSKEFRDATTNLAKFLNIQTIDHLTAEELFLSCVIALENRRDLRVLPDKGFKLASIEKVTSGFDTGDNVTNTCGKILRLLHIQNLRSFQTMINQLIVSVQEKTANPKTNSALGRVGR